MRNTILVGLLFSAFTVSAAPVSKLTVYAYPDSGNTDWSTPKSLIKGFLDVTVHGFLMGNSDVKFVSDFNEPGEMSSNYYSNMGHTISHIECRLESGRWYDHWASMTGMYNTALLYNNIFNKQLGLGFVLYDYVDGHLISGAENRMKLIYYKGPWIADDTGTSTPARPRYVEFKLEGGDCDELKKMISFFESFHYPPSTTYAELEAKNPEEVLHFSPDYMPYRDYVRRMQTGHGNVGGGCANFAIGLVQAANKLDADLNGLLLGRMPVSEKLIGGTVVQDTGEIRAVSLSQLLLTDLGNHWQYPGIKNRIIEGYSPQQIWKFIGEAMECLHNNNEKCPRQTNAWLNKNGSRIQRGEQQIFSGTVNNVGGAYETKQPVDGIVVGI